MTCLLQVCLQGRTISSNVNAWQGFHLFIHQWIWQTSVQNVWDERPDGQYSYKIHYFSKHFLPEPILTTKVADFQMWDEILQDDLLIKVGHFETLTLGQFDTSTLQDFDSLTLIFGSNQSNSPRQSSNQGRTLGPHLNLR